MLATSGNATAVHNDSFSSPTMTNITATATLTSGSSSDGAVAIYNNFSSATMTSITATSIASGGGIASGVVQDGGSVLIRDSFLSGGAWSAYSTSGGTVKILNSVLSGPQDVGAANCVNVVTPALAAITCG